MGIYADAFRAVGFTDQEDMLGMTELDLVDDVQVPFAVHRRRILAHAARRNTLLARESVIWALLCVGAWVLVVAAAAFAIALMLNPRLRNQAGAYAGVAAGAYTCSHFSST
jgi:hypothetical protein